MSWELVQAERSGTDTDRIQVPGGWLYRVTLWDAETDSGRSVSTCFVPEHKSAREQFTDGVAASPPADWPASDMAEAAMGIISNASDWDRDDRAEWKTAARRWLDEYAALPDEVRAAAADATAAERERCAVIADRLSTRIAKEIRAALPENGRGS